MKTPDGKPCYRRLGFNLVSWDGEPEQYIEPVQYLGMSQEQDAVVPLTDGAGNCAGFQFFEGEPFRDVTEFHGNG